MEAKPLETLLEEEKATPVQDQIKTVFSGNVAAAELIDKPLNPEKDQKKRKKKNKKKRLDSNFRSYLVGISKLSTSTELNFLDAPKIFVIFGQMLLSLGSICSSLSRLSKSTIPFSTSVGLIF